MSNDSAAPRIAMMMAMDRNRLIGRENGMPWHIPGEQLYFKSVTMGKPIIMGRKTYESIGRPLPGRTNIVVTRNADWQADGTEVVDSLDAALHLAAAIARRSDPPVDETVIIGGAALCREAMPRVQRLYLTYIDHAYEGDIWLDSFEATDWRETSRRDLPPADTDGIPVSYLVLEPIPA